MAAVRFSDCEFQQLTINELYAILRLRSAVFVVEQNCVFLDLDGSDRYARHLFGKLPSGEIVACARWYLDGDDVVLGRIVTDIAHRGAGHGKEVMRQSLRRIGSRPIRLHAQSHLQRFYGSFGFVTCGEEFLEDGIPHVLMRRGADAATP